MLRLVSADRPALEINRDSVVVGRGATYSDAIKVAYEAASRIAFEGMQFRRDIGQKALAV